MNDGLDTLEAACWHDLKAAADQSHGWRTPVLATTRSDHTPNARTVILRAANADTRTIEIHTDVLSEKWSELTAVAAGCLVFYDRNNRAQLRLDCTATLYGPGTQRQSDVWNKLSAWTRTTYCGGPPGHIVAKPPETQPQRTPPTHAQTAAGHARFGVIVLHVSAMDWYQHPRGDIRRARFSYDATGDLRSADWIAP